MPISSGSSDNWKPRMSYSDLILLFNILFRFNRAVETFTYHGDCPVIAHYNHNYSCNFAPAQDSYFHRTWHAHKGLMSRMKYLLSFSDQPSIGYLCKVKTSTIISYDYGDAIIASDSSALFPLPAIQFSVPAFRPPHNVKHSPVFQRK